MPSIVHGGFELLCFLLGSRIFFYISLKESIEWEIIFQWSVLLCHITDIYIPAVKPDLENLGLNWQIGQLNPDFNSTNPSVHCKLFTFTISLSHSEMRSTIFVYLFVPLSWVDEWFPPQRRQSLGEVPAPPVWHSRGGSPVRQGGGGEGRDFSFIHFILCMFVKSS